MNVTVESPLRAHLRAAHGVEEFHPDATEESLVEYHRWDHDTGEMGPSHDPDDLGFGIGATYEVTVPVDVTAVVDADGNLTITGFTVPHDIGSQDLWRYTDDGEDLVSLPLGTDIGAGTTGDDLLNAAAEAVQARIGER